MRKAQVTREPLSPSPPPLPYFIHGKEDEGRKGKKGIFNFELLRIVLALLMFLICCFFFFEIYSGKGEGGNIFIFSSHCKDDTFSFDTFSAGVLTSK